MICNFSICPLRGCGTWLRYCVRVAQAAGEGSHRSRYSSPDLLLPSLPRPGITSRRRSAVIDPRDSEAAAGVRANLQSSSTARCMQQARRPAKRAMWKQNWIDQRICTRISAPQPLQIAAVSITRYVIDGNLPRSLKLLIWHHCRERIACAWGCPKRPESPLVFAHHYAVTLPSWQCDHLAVVLGVAAKQPGPLRKTGGALVSPLQSAR